MQEINFGSFTESELWAYLVQWDGLPFTNCSWECQEHISDQFEPAEYDNQVPDLSHIPDDVINRCLELADHSAIRYAKNNRQHSHTPKNHSLQFPLPRKRAPSPTVELPPPKRVISAVPNQVDPGQPQPVSVFGTPDWKSFFPVSMVSRVWDITDHLRLRFRAGIPDDGQGGITDEYLRCLLGHEWLSDYPINKIGECIGDPNTVYYDGAQQICYVSSLLSVSGSRIAHDFHLIGVNAQLYIFGYNFHANHWNLAVYSFPSGCWLILDSVHRSPEAYLAQVTNCRNVLLQITDRRVPNNAQVVASTDWPQQPNGYDCGVYTALGVIFVAKNSCVGGLVDQMMEGRRVALPAFPCNFISRMREELYCLSKLLAEPFTPHFVVTVS